jgi:hypothetical protein
MGAAADAWADSGIAVRGLAVSAAAAGVLTTEAGIATETVAKFLYEHDRPGGPDPQWRLRRGEVVVLDEAAMVASADLAKVVTLAERARAKVVLVGDHRQLGAVEAGGLFRLLATETNAAELSGVRRFHAEWERAASLRLRAGDASVVEQYLSQGRVVGGERSVMVEEAFGRWWMARARGDSVVVCAADHATVNELVTRARAARVAAGEVEPGGVVAGEHTVGVGDEIVTCRNDRRLVTTAGAWVGNGDRWRVLARQRDDALLVEDLAGRGRVVLPGDYVGEAVALAYAVTIHKAQGLTVDSAIILVDERTTAEGLYVGMTRGRAHNVALAVCDEADAEHAAGPTRRPSEVLVAALGRSAAEVAALEALREALARSESLATLAPRLANLDAWIATQTPPDRSRELQWAADGLEHARRCCRPGHLTRAGRDDRRRLEAAEARYDAVAVEQGQRQAWLEAHADTLAYRDELAEAVTKRRRDLGVAAAVTQPDHIVDILGAPPSTDARGAVGRWMAMAGHIEAYREEWGVEPQRLTERPRDLCQGQAWEAAVHAAQLLSEPPAPVVERGLDRGIGLEL